MLQRCVMLRERQPHDEFRSTPRPLDVTFVDGNSPRIDKTDCKEHSGTCELYYHGTGTISGSANGSANYVGHGHYRGASLVYTQVVHPIETRGACGGHGTFKFIERNVLSPLNPPQLGLAGIGSWQILPGSGTGALKGATGGGLIIVVLHGGVEARVLGAITCRVIGPSRRHKPPAALQIPNTRAASS